MASLFAALTTAVSGLSAQSSAIGNISDDLANAQTVGYKSVGTTFEELVNSSSSTQNNPGGVTATPSYQNDVQGSITSSNTSTNLALSGAGYFAVETATTNATGQTSFNSSTYYTRQGDFTLNKDGYLVNGSGYYLTGWGINSSGTTNTSTTAPIQVSALQNDPVKTSAITYTANLPSNAAIGYVASTSTLQVYDAIGNTEDVNYTWTKIATNQWDLNVSIPNATDSNGAPYNTTVPVTFNDGSVAGTTAGTIASIGAATLVAQPSFTVATYPITSGNFSIGTTPDNVTIPWSDASNGGTISTIDVGGSSVSLATPLVLTAATNTATLATNMKLLINAAGGASGLPANFTMPTATVSGSAITLSSWGGTGTAQAITPDSGGTTGQVTWTAGSSADGTVAATDPSPYTPASSQITGTDANVGISVTFPGGTTQPITLNFGTFGGSTGVTQFSDTNSTVTVSNFSQDGLPKGSFNSISIDTDGFVSLNYSNGTNKVISQIPIAQFYAQDQLQRVTGGAYTTTLTSGSARLGAAGTLGAGTVASSSLEQSNVDIATQFTALIQAQQVYTANSKVVTTDNTLLQTTLNMVQ